MNRLALGGIAVLVLAGSVVAAPAFDIAPGVVGSLQIDEGQSAWVDIVGTAPTNPSGFQGMELYSVLEGPFQITSVLIDQPGAGTGFVGNSTGAYIDFTDPKAAIGMVTTASGFIPAGSIVAKVQIKAVGPSGSTGNFTTDGSQFWGAPSNFADGMAAVQDTLQLSIIPEPTTALLLLGALPLIRRRWA